VQIGLIHCAVVPQRLLSSPGKTVSNSFMGLLKRSFHKSYVSLEGKTVVITGANTGIGYETAKGLLQKGETE
jgi:hypothetical protein